MVVNVLVHIESYEDIKSVAKVDLPWNKHITSKNWEKVCGMDYWIQMNNRHDPVLLLSKSGSTIHMSLSGSGSSKDFQKWWTSAHEKISSPTLNEKNRWTLAMSKPLIPGLFDLMFRMMQSLLGSSMTAWHKITLGMIHWLDNSSGHS